MLIKRLLERNAYLIAITITILVAYLSLQSNGVEVPFHFNNMDKVLHTFAYYVLTTSWLFAFRNKKFTYYIVFFLLGYGILLEFFQDWFTSNRTKDVFDVLANTIGIIIATYTFKYIYNYFVKKFG